MWPMGNFAFAAPWALMALLVLPIIWQLLKITPPKPTTIRFPAVRILQELSTSQIISTKTPWWILLLRFLIIMFLIAAMAKPLWNAAENTPNIDKTLIVVIDNDWSVIDRWGERQGELNILLERADRSQQSVLIVPTATPQNIWPLKIETAFEARKRSRTLKPQPWPSDRAGTLSALKEKLVEISHQPSIIWISNGMLENHNDDFMNALHQLGVLNLIRDAEQRLPIVIADVKRAPEGLKVRITRAETDRQKSIELRLQDDQANTLFQQTVELALDVPHSEVILDLPPELRARADRLRIEGYMNTGAQFLLDERWRDRPVGLIKSLNQDQNLLDPTYYIRKSLRPHAILREDNLDNLLARELSVLFDTGQQSFSKKQNKAISNWISKGGVFVRFASESLAKNTQENDSLLPVSLLQGVRTLGGALSWKQPTNLSPFPDHSPFFGLPIPKDISIKRHILTRPEPTLAQKTWASLGDGTPLVSAQERGKGWTVLFHISGAPNWSNLPLSGTFEMMMTRLLSLSLGMQVEKRDQDLAPYLIFNANAQLVPPNGIAKPIAANTIKTFKPSSQSPAGLYGQEKSFHALNLGPSINEIIPLSDIPLGTVEQGFHDINEIDLSPWALFTALCLALLDWMVSLSLRGMLKASTALIPFLMISSALANDGPQKLQKTIAAASKMRLAYMVTQDERTDQASKQGLDGLGMMLRRRTAVELAKPMAYDPEVDDPSLFPMIYWPIVETQEQISEAAAEKLNRFLRTGGFILFDTQGQKRPAQLAKLTQHLDMPRLQVISSEHVLTRSFYLMQRFPGRLDHSDIWVESHEDQTRDRVSSVLIGANSWAQAWARDESMRPLYAVIPGGEIQREQAYRFGINLVMYILSGNYKGDQVHMPAILQRLGL